jgi:hypothetical protein
MRDKSHNKNDLLLSEDMKVQGQALRRSVSLTFVSLTKMAQVYCAKSIY